MTTDGPADPSSTAAIILCGGQSSRFGTDKALTVFEGRTLLERAVATARGVADQVILATGPEVRYANQDLVIATDAEPGRGPIAGIAAGLARADREFFVLFAVDMPFVTSEVLSALLASLPGHDLVVPRTPEGLEPLCIAGRTEPCRAAARRLLGGKDAAARDLPKIMAAGEYRVEGSGMGARVFANLNTIEDLRRHGSGS